ncbi:hypothetical protein FSP39_024696 [Pinctada imbricata]|uniref:Ankyrin repeat protein n=1 Tax=Pinctada imbricata TaxID=66713 RepID=A0AA89C1W6_PINIB|nr:hypothetical protein FSP39_024696 [Pinctada imbricata]
MILTDVFQTKIGVAIQQGDFRLVKSLIDGGENVHFTDRKGNTYLHYVCTMYRPYVFHVIAGAGIDINAQNKYGYTPLHVTALSKEGLHVGDLMAYGADPSVLSYDGKTAMEMATKRKYWRQVYEKYKPGIFQAVEDHDVERVKELLHCWCKMDSKRGSQTLRQVAAAKKYHDIVRILDQHRYTLDVIYGVLELDYQRVQDAVKKSWCNINFVNKACRRKHVLQHAIRMRELDYVKILCDWGADVNLLVNAHDFLMGPLYYEVIDVNTPPDIMWTVLKSNVNFNIKDERGRNALTYALDRGNGEISLDVFKFMLQNGAYLGDRDDTGVGTREVAKFAWRLDVMSLIDKFYIKVIRDSDISMLRRLAIDGYCGLFIYFNYRDSYVYASGNETDDALKFIEWLPGFQDRVSKLHSGIRDGESISHITNLIENYEERTMLINAKDKGLRTPLILATLFARDDIVKYLLTLQGLDVNGVDCCKRSALHYTYVLGVDGENIRRLLIQAGIERSLTDVRGRTAEQYDVIPNKQQWIDREIMAQYGMEYELKCVEKYQELRRIIRAKKEGLNEFTECLRDFTIPVASFPKVLDPLMPAYRDLIFLAVDYGKEDIAIRLANIGADLSRKEKARFG